MYCQKCKAEYQAGTSRCARCEAALVESQEDAPDRDHDLVDFLRTPDVAMLTVVKSLLDSADIPYVVQGEEGLRMFPAGVSGGFFNPSALGAVIRLRREDLEDATQLLTEHAPSPDAEEDSGA